MLGSDQYKNDLSNNIIIKCHECGDTNLRYLGGDRTGEPEKPYKCGNGHITWGALDEWETKGQTDTLLNTVNDCCCEGTSLDFPKSIKVNFDGIIGVQGREGSYFYDESTGLDSYNENLTADVSSRVKMPYHMCPPCFSFDLPDAYNGPWTFACGTQTASGSCSSSDDASKFEGFIECDGCEGSSSCDGCFGGLGEWCETIYRAINVEYSLARIITNRAINQPCPVHSISVGTNALPCCLNRTVSKNVEAGPFFSSIPDIGGPTFIFENTGKSFDFNTGQVSDCPEQTQQNVPIESNPLEIVPPPIDHVGSMYFVRYVAWKVKSKRNFDGTFCCCVSVHFKHYHLTRVHPTADNNSLSGWQLSQDGINPAYADMTHFETIGSCDGCEYEDPGMPELINISPDWFCDMSQENTRCTDCFDPIDATHTDIETYPKTIWPFRIPAFTTTHFNYENEYQLIRQADGSYSDSGYIKSFECGCKDSWIGIHGSYKVDSEGCPDTYQPCVNTPWNTQCGKDITYPPCLKSGNSKCEDVDARFRVQCANPDDYFTVTVGEGGANLLTQRYTLDFIPETQGECGLHQIYVYFHPKWVTRGSAASSDTIGPQTADLFVYPKHPNAACPEPTPGILTDYGFPRIPNASVNPNWDGGADGIRRVTLDKLVQDPSDAIQQPHCLRRVKNPYLIEGGALYYAVNTADISNQDIILDRFFSTNSSYNYMQHDKYAIDGKTDKAYINFFGDQGLTHNFYGARYPYPDYLPYNDDGYVGNGLAFPWPYIANSGSAEEPEIVAIIHSEQGSGGQIAFQTFPISYDTDELLDVSYDFLESRQINFRKGTCEYKNRITVHGYGVMYPLKDDPLWQNKDYPIILQGSKYKIGDKIEFRCWKCLEDANERGANPGDNEEIWKEECIETVIATATITELANIRVAPATLKAKKVYGPSGDEVSLDVQFPFIQSTYLDLDHWVIDKETFNNANGKDAYWKPKENLPHPVFDVGDILTCTLEADFNGRDLAGDFVHVKPEYLDDKYCQNFNEVNDKIYGIQGVVFEVTQVDQDGKVLDIDIKRFLWCNEDCASDPTLPESDDVGAFYAYITNGGIAWYEFDEKDDNDNYLIAVGNNPCDFDLCVDPNPDVFNFNPNAECIGCFSKTVYPEPEYDEDDNLVSGHIKIDAIPRYSEFGTPSQGCYSSCQPAGTAICPEQCSYTINCKYDCQLVLGEVQCGIGKNIIIAGGDDCYQNNCSCFSVGDIDVDGTAAGTKYNSNCVCYPGYVGPWTDPYASEPDPDNPDDEPEPGCWPLANTWKFYENNYGITNMSGIPVEQRQTAMLDGITNTPPKRTQWKMSWLPKTRAFMDAIEDYLPDDIDKPVLNEIIDSYLAIEGCNPLKLDRFDKSYKFPGYDFTHSDIPCAKPESRIAKIIAQINAQGPCTYDLPVTRTTDEYCRVYGFYQQIQPTCEVTYKGQYILRASQKMNANNNTKHLNETDCEPIIENMYINLKQKEAKFDISVGAPYSQDYLLPDQLPTPYANAQGILESTADAWNQPSLVGHNNERFFDHGFFEPIRKAYTLSKYIQDESADQFDLISQTEIIPDEQMYDVDGQDWTTPPPPTPPAPSASAPDNGEPPSPTPSQTPTPTPSPSIACTLPDVDDLVDIYLDGTWDLPDPRSNARSNVPGLTTSDGHPKPNYDFTNNYPYADIGIQIPWTGYIYPDCPTRADYRYLCPYPWEDTSAISFIEPDDQYCMFKNNSAEIVLEEIVPCEYCSSNEIVKYDAHNIVLNKNKGYSIGYASTMHYTWKAMIKRDKQVDEYTPPFGDPFTEVWNTDEYLLFRCYGDADGKFTEAEFYNLIMDYILIWEDRKHIDTDQELGKVLLDIFEEDTQRRIFWNYIFEGANNKQLHNLTKVEVFTHKVKYFASGGYTFEQFMEDPSVWDLNCGVQEAPCIQPENLIKQFEETRCDYPHKGGSVKSVRVNNPGSGYAFEIEERVAATGIPWFVEKEPSENAPNGGKITPLITPYIVMRRSEAYTLEDITVSGVLSKQYREDPEWAGGLGYIEIEFNDLDKERNKVFYLERNGKEDKPVVSVRWNPDNGKVINVQVENPGTFWKYIKTGEHRAFPVAIVLNNYWNYGDGRKEGREIGKNAILRPVIGVDPKEPESYGKIKKVEVEYGGIDYVLPAHYWTINTQTGMYDTVTGDLKTGLDIRHLVDPCQFEIDGDGISSTGINHYQMWLGSVIPAIPDDILPTYDEWTELIYPDLISPEENPYKYSKKYYYHTGADNAVDGRIIKWQDRVEDWETVIQSGSPFDYGGLLDREYNMALVEEVDMVRGSFGVFQPLHSHCREEVCDSLLDYNCYTLDLRDPRCDGGNPDDPGGDDPDDGPGDPVLPASAPPEELYGADGPPGYPANCDLAVEKCHFLQCNTFTAYDAHRYNKSAVGLAFRTMPLFGDRGFPGSWQATARPYLIGCQGTLPFTEQTMNVGTATYCNEGRTDGWADIKTASNPDDKCYEAEYSMYGEFSKILTATGEQPLLRGYMITYKMNRPITMNIKWNDDDFEPPGP